MSACTSSLSLLPEHSLTSFQCTAKLHKMIEKSNGAQTGYDYFAPPVYYEAAKYAPKTGARRVKYECLACVRLLSLTRGRR